MVLEQSPFPERKGTAEIIIDLTDSGLKCPHKFMQAVTIFRYYTAGFSILYVSSTMNEYKLYPTVSHHVHTFFSILPPLNQFLHK